MYLFIINKNNIRMNHLKFLVSIYILYMLIHIFYIYLEYTQTEHRPKLSIGEDLQIILYMYVLIKKLSKEYLP